MKIIVGGAGSVGKSIVAYLSRGNNDVAVVDEDERKLNEVAREWDVMPVLGSVAHPDVLQKAEAGKSDLADRCNRKRRSQHDCLPGGIFAV